MGVIFISDPETVLAVSRGHFTLRTPGGHVGRIPPLIMDQVVACHGVEVTPGALDRLGAMGIPVTFLDREGRVQSRLMPVWKQDATARLGQARAYFDEELRLQMARRLVDAKIANGAAMVRLHAGNHPHQALSEGYRALQEMRRRIPSAAGIEEIMGVEGMAGRLYFGCLARMLRVDWTSFTGRNRQPPLDPANAVLSYAYAVLMHQVMSFAEAAGLDPCVGYLHRPEPGRPSLALDLMEPFRPVLGDRLMLRLMNLDTLRAEHFSEARGPGKGVFISREGRLELLKVFTEWSGSCDETLSDKLTSPGRLLLAEVEKFTLLARKGALSEYQPYLAPQAAPNPALQTSRATAR